MYSLIYGQKEKLACATAGRWSSVIKFVQCACFSQLCFPKRQLKHCRWVLTAGKLLQILALGLIEHHCCSHHCQTIIFVLWESWKIYFTPTSNSIL